MLAGMAGPEAAPLPPAASMMSPTDLTPGGQDQACLMPSPPPPPWLPIILPFLESHTEFQLPP